ncbi:MAG: glycosyltransferase family 4 protein [Petrotogales bacterium]
MNILMLLSNPLVVDPRVFKEAKALTEKGHNVTVIVWDKRNEYESEEDLEEIKVFRVHEKGVSKMIPGVLLKNLLWWWRAYRKSIDVYREGFDFDAVHCHDFDTLKIGSWLKKKFGCKLVYDAHEIFSLMIKDEHPILSRFSFIMEKRLIKNVDHIITIDKPFKEYYKKFFDKSITIVMNCKDLVYSEYKPADNDIFTLVYIGIMGRGRFFPEIMEIVGELDDARLILAGKKELLFDEMRELSTKYENVEFLGTISTEEILPLTRKADATFVLADNKGQHHMNVFNKQFEAMVCGRPIIITKGTFAAEMTEKLGCGLTVDFDKESVRKTIITLRDNPQLCERLGKNALKAAKERYNWEEEKNNLLDVYEDLK